MWDDDDLMPPRKSKLSGSKRSVSPSATSPPETTLTSPPEALVKTASQKDVDVADVEENLQKSFSTLSKCGEVVQLKRSILVKNDPIPEDVPKKKKKSSRVYQSVARMGETEGLRARKEEIGTDDLSLDLRGFQSRLANNTEIFFKHYRNTLDFRTKKKYEGFENLKWMIVADFESYVRHKSAENPNTEANRMRFATHQDSTLSRAASSAIYFLVFLNDHCADATRKSSIETVPTNRIELLMQFFSAMSTAEKTATIVRFATWYGKLPPARISVKKLLSSNLLEKRAMRKENSTITTVIKGLFCYLTFVDCVELSFYRSPTIESQRMWQAIRESLKLQKRINGGASRTDLCSLSVSDISNLLVKNHPEFSTVFDLQAVLLVITLAGSGLSVGSIRNKAKCVSSNYKKTLVTQSSLDMDETTASLQPHDSETIDLDFTHMTTNNVRVFRVSGDDDQQIRLEVELSVQYTRTSGNSAFRPTLHQFSWPCLDSGDEEDSMPNAAIALMMLSILGGNTTIDDVLAPLSPAEKCLSKKLVSKLLANPLPLFRAGTTQHGFHPSDPLNNPSSSLSLVCRIFELPAALYTSTSCRRGFARAKVEGFVQRTQSETVISSDRVKDVLNTSTHWKSGQSLRYISDVLSVVVSAHHTNVGITAYDWNIALFKSGPFSRAYAPDSTYATAATLVPVDLDDNAELNLTFHERTQMADASNLARWKQAIVRRPTSDQLQQLYSAKPRLDIRATLMQFRLFQNVTSMCFQNIVPIEEGKTIICPVANCGVVCADAVTSNSHWIEHHAKSYAQETFRCQLCKLGQKSKWRCFRRHLVKRHPVSERTPFRFHFLSSHDDHHASAEAVLGNVDANEHSQDPFEYTSDSNEEDVNDDEGKDDGNDDDEEEGEEDVAEKDFVF